MRIFSGQSNLGKGSFATRLKVPHLKALQLKVFQLKGMVLGIVLAFGYAAAPAQAITLKIATVSPSGSMWMRELKQAATDIAERTEGRVKFKFYPGGVMGDDKAVLRKMRVGQLHGAVLTVGVLSQNYPDLNIYGLPLVFRNHAELDYVRERMDPKIMAGLESKGYVSFGIAEIGFAYMMSKSGISSVADLRKQKVWTPDGDLGTARGLEAFGVSPIPLTIADVLGGLQTGLIDTVAAPPVGAITLQWHTRVGHLTKLPLLYTYGLLTVGDRQFKKVSAADKIITRELMGQAVAKVNARSREDNAKAALVLEQQGLKWNEPTPAQLVEWQTVADKANVELVEEGFVSKQAWAEMQGYLAELR